MLLGPTTAFKNNVSHRDLRPADFCRANVGYFSRAAKLVKAIWHSQRVKARRLGAKGALTGGGVCFWQWFGSRLQLTPHLHLLVPEAVWTPNGEAVLVPPPDDEEVLTVLQRVLRRAAKHWPEDLTLWAEDAYQAMQHDAVQSHLGVDETPMPRHRIRRVAVSHASRFTQTPLSTPMTGRDWSDWPGMAPAAPLRNVDALGWTTAGTSTPQRRASPSPSPPRNWYGGWWPWCLLPVATSPASTVFTPPTAACGPL